MRLPTVWRPKTEDWKARSFLTFRLSFLCRILCGEAYTRTPRDIDSLPNFGPVNTVRKAKWRMLKDARNEFIHCGEMPGIQERKLLIEEVLQLEKDLRAQPAEAKVRPGN